LTVRDLNLRGEILQDGILRSEAFWSSIT
jgi:hypothetical protein